MYISSIGFRDINKCLDRMRNILSNIAIYKNVYADK